MGTYHVAGPCTIAFNGVDIGTSAEGVTIAINGHYVPVNDDQHGQGIADMIFVGRDAQVRMLSLEPTKLHGLDPVLAAATYDRPGVLLREYAKTLLVTERDNSPWAAPLAFPVFDQNDMVLSSRTELRIPIMFLIFPTDEGKLFTTIPEYIV